MNIILTETTLRIQKSPRQYLQQMVDPGVLYRSQHSQEVGYSSSNSQLRLQSGSLISQNTVVAYFEVAYMLF